MLGVGPFKAGTIKILPAWNHQETVLVWCVLISDYLKGAVLPPDPTTSQCCLTHLHETQKALTHLVLGVLSSQDSLLFVMQAY